MAIKIVSGFQMDCVSPAAVAATDLDRGFMLQALDLAKQAAVAGEVPVGAILVSASGEMLAGASNAPIGQRDPTAHAEMRVLRKAAVRTGNYRLSGTTMYVTLEPCPMCAGALVHARVSRLVYAATDPKAGACGSVMDVARNEQLNHRVCVEGGLLEPQAAELLRAFFKARR